MKTNKYIFILPVILLFLTACINGNGSHIANSQKAYKSTGRQASEIMTTIRKVNDYWQSAHPEHGDAFWNRATYHIGNMAAYELTGEEQYLNYSSAWAEKNEWKGAKSDNKSNWKYKPYGEGEDFVLFGDWQTCFQVYMDLYNIEPEGQKILRVQEVMDYQISTTNDDYWWWADGLFMVMPVMTKMYKLTGEEIYLDKLYEYFSYAKNLMFDNESSLFYRDEKYIYPYHKTDNGLKDFWARGNGWVFAALAKVLEDLPDNNEHKNEYIEVYESLAVALAASQQEEGYWTRSILDPEYVPGYETSGTAFFTYGFLWGVNNGYLDEAEYLPVINKAWRYLTEIALQPDGKLGYIQPIGERADQHKNVGPDTTADFGVGAFLLAACEMARCLN